MAPTSNWTPEMVRRLRELSTGEYSKSIIAHILNVEFGTRLTRNSIIGKASRIGIQYREPVRLSRLGTGTAPTRRKQTIRAPRATATKPPPQDAPMAIGPVDDFPDAGMCRWIDADPLVRGWRCCGQPVSDTTWCSYHSHRSINHTAQRSLASIARASRPRTRPF